MANQKIPSYLNAEQRQALMEIPSDLSERDLARYYSFTQEELKLIFTRFCGDREQKPDLIRRVKTELLK